MKMRFFAIKDNIDIKELEKYGYKKEELEFKYDIDFSKSDFLDKYNVKIEPVNQKTKIIFLVKEIDYKLDKLIKDGIVDEMEEYEEEKEEE